MTGIVKTFERPDGLVRVVIHAHTPAPPNIFGFTKQAWTEECNDSTGEAYEYWLPDYQSGLYDSVESAEAEARAMFPWIADQT